jgi:sialidase-1
MLRNRRMTIVTMMLSSACGLAAAEQAASQAGTSLFEDVHVVKLPKAEYGYRGMPGTMIQLKDGRILLAYTRILPNGQSDGGIGARYSSDKGKTWTEDFAIVPGPTPQGKHYYCHPSFLRLANGDILMSYIYSPGSEPLFGHTYYRRSTDDAKTWSDQLVITPQWGYHIVHNDKLVQLSGGRILAPAETQSRSDRGDHAGYVSYTAWSDDNGYKWNRCKNEVNMLPVEAQEPHVVELKDGRVMMLMRTYSGYVGRSYSSDRGESWSKGEAVKELALPRHSSSALNVKRIPKTGDLVLIRCTDGPREPYRWRTPLASVISKDDGQTWVNQRVLMGDPQDDYGYPGLTFVDDMALIVYHQRDGLHVLRVGVDWFYGS